MSLKHLWVFFFFLGLPVLAWAASPVAVDLNKSTSEDVGYLSITLSVSDEDGDALTYTYSQPSHGTTYQTSSNTGTKYVRYTPEADFNGTDTFTYEATDTSGNTSNPATVTIEVSAENDRPVATTTGATLTEDVVTQIQLEGTDVEGDPLTCEIYSTGINCAVTIDAATCIATVTPEADYTGSSMYFRYNVNDGTDTSRVYATVRITVTPANDAPVANDAAHTTNEDSHGSFTVTASDPDGDAIAVWAITTEPEHGTVALSSGNSAVYTPAADFNGTDTFAFTASDGTLTSEPATVTMTVNPDNDGPEATDTSVTTTRNTPVTITFSGADVDGDALTYSTDPSASGPYIQHGNVSAVSGNQVTYTPTTDYVGSDEIRYSVSDGIQTYPDYGVVTISIVDDEASGGYTPVAQDVSAALDEDTTTEITLIATDTDSSDLTFETTSPAHGSLSLDGAVVSYVPQENFEGTDTFTFTATDGEFVSNAAAVTITVRAVNDLPTVDAVVLSVSENSASEFFLSAQDVDDDDHLRIDIVSCDHGAIEVSPNSGNLAVYTSDAGFDGAAVCTYRALDGESESAVATIDITVNQTTNDAPVAQDIARASKEDRDILVLGTASDPEGAALTYAITNSPAHGTLSSDGQVFLYVPDADFYGEDNFTYKANDGVNDSNEATVSLNIAAVVDPVVSCDATVLSEHLKTDASGWAYLDNAITVLTSHPARSFERRRIMEAVGGNRFLCKIEQAALSADEIAGLGDAYSGDGDGYGYYVIAVAPQSDPVALENLAAPLRRFGFVENAQPYWRVTKTLDDAGAGETDMERNGMSPSYMNPSYVQGAWEYMAAATQLNAVEVALIDTGVCANNAFIDACHTTLRDSAVTEEFNDIVRGDPYNFNGAILEVSADQPSGMPLGEVDKSGHGTLVAGLLGALSNNNSADIVYQDPGDATRTTTIEMGNGVLGGVPGLSSHGGLTIRSFLKDAENYVFADSGVALFEPLMKSIKDSCGSDIVNMSFGDVISSTMTNDQLNTIEGRNQAFALVMQNCPSYYVESAGNSYADFDTAASAQKGRFSYYLATPNILAGATATGTRDTPYYAGGTGDDAVGTNHGNTVEIFASADSTSLAAPLVSGAAGMLASILGPGRSADYDRLIMAGADRSNGIPFLNTAATTLLALAEQNPETVPLTLNRSEFVLDAPLSDLRTDAIFSNGTHHESGAVSRNGRTLTVKRYGEEVFSSGDDAENALVPLDPPGDFIGDPYDWWDDASPPEFEFGGITEIIASQYSEEHYALSLATREESASSSVVPIASVLPQGAQEFQTQGKSDYYYGSSYGTSQLELGTAFCLRANYDVNGSEPDTTPGFQVPLAPNPEGATETFTVPYNISAATLTGNLRFRYPNIVGFGNVFYDDTAPSRINYADLETPDCNDDINPTDADNVSSDYYCGVDLEQDDADYTAHITAEIADVNCSLEMTAAYAGQDPESEIITAPDESPLQTFGVTFGNAADTATCSATATLHITWVFQAQLNVYDNAATLAEEFPCQNPAQGVGTYTNRIEQDITVPLTWDFTDGKFPLASALDTIAEHLPYVHMSNFERSGDAGFDVDDVDVYSYADGQSPPLLFDVTRYSQNYTPGFGRDMSPMKWAHGIGPVGRYESEASTLAYDFVGLDKPSRAVP